MLQYLSSRFFRFCEISNLDPWIVFDTVSVAEQRWCVENMTYTPHYEKFNARLMYVKYALIVHNETYVKHYTFNVCFYHTLYMRCEKRTFNAEYEKHAFCHSL